MHLCKKTIASTALALVFGGVIGGCATRSFDSTWRNPEAGPVTLAGRQVVALVISTSEPTRRVAEDAVARRITERGGKGVAAYTLVPATDIEDAEKARAAFTRAGAVGLVTMEVVSQDRQPPSTTWHHEIGIGRHREFWGGYARRWGVAHEQPRQSNVVVWVETRVYSLDPEELLWAGRGRSTNPAEAETLFGQLAGGAAKEMERAGLLPPGPSR